MNWNDLQNKIVDICAMIAIITTSLAMIILVVMLIAIAIRAIKGDDISKHRTRTGNSVSAPLILPMLMPR